MNEDNSWQKPKKSMKAHFSDENQFVTQGAPFGTMEQ
jgi:hypothetical protein